MAKDKKKQTTVKGTIIAVVLVVLVLGYFNYLSNRSSATRSEAQKTEIEELSEYDMAAGYPKTPRDVAKLHNRYFKAFYAQELSDEELDAMNQKLRMLYCRDLLIANPEANSLEKLKTDIENVKEQGYTYKLCELPEASQVEYFTDDGREMAKLEVCITIDTGDNMAYYYRQYLMIKEEDKWKIYGWEESSASAATETSAE